LSLDVNMPVEDFGGENARLLPPTAVPRRSSPCLPGALSTLGIKKTGKIGQMPSPRTFFCRRFLERKDRNTPTNRYAG
jgi:hypothetical protein